jgi:hypothetical protein
MADYYESISEPVPPPSHPSPHALTPPGWDESAGFRETFLRHVTDAEEDRTLRHLARMLHEATLELAHFAPPSGESATREELRAAAADLRHLQGFLAAVARVGAVRCGAGRAGGPAVPCRRRARRCAGAGPRLTRVSSPRRMPNPALGGCRI